MSLLKSLDKRNLLLRVFTLQLCKLPKMIHNDSQTSCETTIVAHRHIALAQILAVLVSSFKAQRQKVTNVQMINPLAPKTSLLISCHSCKD